jgi:hypothetical protein
MSRNYVIVENGTVVNIAVSDEALAPNWIQDDTAQIGWTYDGTSFYPPPSPAEPDLPRIITKIAFRYRMTDDEYVGVLSAAKTDVEVAAWVETFNMVTKINLDDQRTKDGVAKLVSKSLLTETRANEILTNPVQPDEIA